MPILVVLAYLIVGCAGRAVPSGNKTGNYNDYNEDLSDVRPAYVPTSTTVTVKVSTPANPVVPETNQRTNTTSVNELNVTKRLDGMMEVISAKNRAVRYASGYRIQIYNGNERQQAESAKMLIYQNFPELNTYLSYKQPTYRLKVGDFMRKVDAERYFSQLKAVFTSAVLQPDKVDIRRSMAVN